MCSSLTLRLSKGWEIRSDRLVSWAIVFYTPSSCFPSPTGFLLSGTMCFVGWQILWVSLKCVSTRRVKCRFLSRSAEPEVQDELTLSFSYSILSLKSDVLLWLIAVIRAFPWHGGMSVPSSASLQAGLSSYHVCRGQRLCSKAPCPSDAAGKLPGTSHGDAKGAHGQLCVTHRAACAEQTCPPSGNGGRMWHPQLA